MFENLSERLSGVFDRLTKQGALSEEDVKTALREVRVALLEADVSLPVARDFVKAVQDKATGQAVTKSITPGQQVVKIVHDALIDTLKGEGEPGALKIDSPPAPILMVGLQGSGKTTTAGKLALRLIQRERKKVLLAGLDVQRPAAQEQLRILGDQAGASTLAPVIGEQPLGIAKAACADPHRGGRADPRARRLPDPAHRLRPVVQRVQHIARCYINGADRPVRRRQPRFGGKADIAVGIGRILIGMVEHRRRATVEVGIIPRVQVHIGGPDHLRRCAVQQAFEYDNSSTTRPRIAARHHRANDGAAPVRAPPRQVVCIARVELARIGVAVVCGDYKAGTGRRRVVKSAGAGRAVYIRPGRYREFGVLAENIECQFCPPLAGAE